MRCLNISIWWDSIGQQLLQRPYVVRYSHRHRRGHLSPLLGRATALGGKRGTYLLPQPTVRQAEMVVARTQMQLSLQPVVILRKAQCLAGETSIDFGELSRAVVPYRAILPLHKSGVDVVADR